MRLVFISSKRACPSCISHRRQKTHLKEGKGGGTFIQVFQKLCFHLSPSSHFHDQPALQLPLPPIERPHPHSNTHPSLPPSTFPPSPSLPDPSHPGLLHLLSETGESHRMIHHHPVKRGLGEKITRAGMDSGVNFLVVCAPRDHLLARGSQQYGVLILSSVATCDCGHLDEKRSHNFKR